MTATIIDGKAIAAGLRARSAMRVAEIKKQHGLTPGLAVVLVGNDPASEIYVRNKAKASGEIGMRSFEHRLSASASAAELLSLLDRLNKDDTIDGILVQLPLPRQIDPALVLDAIHPDKDVDGFHVMNAGRLAIGRPALVPDTPVGCEILLRSVRPDLTGAHAVIIGRSNIVGRPLAQLLLKADCTVTVTHSKTRGLPDLCRTADILVVAVGRAELVRGSWIKPGAIVIDVGINRVPSADGKSRVVGDVAFAEAVQVAGAITPVPGGVGPMTIACLLRNTVIAACRRRSIDPGEL